MAVKTAIDFLVVDDDATYRERLVTALRERKYSVLECGGVNDAIALIAANEFSRALVDLRMPERSGLELVEYIAEHQPDCAVVVLTGYGSIATTLSAVKLGALSYLTKPVGVAQILDAFEPDVSPSAELPVPSLPQVEWHHIQRVVNDCDGNISQAAKLLGLHRRSLQRKLQRPPGKIA